jgi:hypothetical protein
MTMSDSATLLLGLLIALAVPVVAVTVAIRSVRASHDVGHPGAYFPDPWGEDAPLNSQGTASTGAAEDDIGVPPGYYPDPTHVAVRRYWDGATWTKATQGKPL